MTAVVIGVLAVAGMGLAALCAVGDAGLLALDPEEPPSRPGVARLVRERERIHRALVMAGTLLHLVVGATVAIALRLEARTPLAAVVLAIVAALVIVALTESLANAVGDGLDETSLERLAPSLFAIAAILSPVVALWDATAARLRRRIPTREEEDNGAREEAERLRQLVTGAPRPQARVSGREQAMLHGVFSLGEIEVKDVMMPRVDIVGIEWETPWAEVVARVRSSEHARFPVFVETLDDIRGILYAKDLLPAVIVDEEPAGGWLALVRQEAVFIPETKPIDAQLREFQAQRTHIAIVVDEYGGTAGLVTIEDVLEEIFGEIRDEYDVEDPAIEQEEGRRFWVAGEVPLDEFCELVDLELDLDDVDTVGGLVYATLGRVPRPGEEFTLGHFRVIVEQVRRRRVKRVYFERLEAMAGREEER